MALKVDHSNLSRGEGLTPDEAPRFIGVLADAWREANEERSATHVSSGHAFRHSDAGKCARALSYKAAGIPQSDPMDLTGVWNVTLGQMLHDHWQEQLVRMWDFGEVDQAVMFGGNQVARIDVTVEQECATEGVDSVGFIDAVLVVTFVDDTTWTIAYELKSIGGFGYKAAVGKARRGSPAEGPKSEHILQGALNALAIDADELVIGYLSKECISANVGRGMDEMARFCCEWTFTREQFEPLARKEAERVGGILDLVKDGQLAARKMLELPPGAEITDPATGAWQQSAADGSILDAGTVWNCGYCSWKSLCTGTDSGRIPVEQAVLLSGAA